MYREHIEFNGEFILILRQVARQS